MANGQPHTPSSQVVSSASFEGTESSQSKGAMQQVLDNLNDLPNSTGAKDLDLLFLRGIMESPIVRSLAKAHEKLEDTKLEAVRDNNLELVKEIINDITPIAKENDTAAELSHILQEPHFQSLLEAHDSVASKNYETPPPSPESYMDSTFNNQPVPPDAVRMVGIRKVKGEHLGVTFRVENSELVIARILHGGMIDQQGLLHVGDIIKEVNGKEVGNDPKVLQEMLQNASGSVILKILPSYQEPHPPRQACHVKEGGSAGLIPSQLLEEKRKAFVKRDWDFSTPSGALCGSMGGKRKKKMMYLTTKNAEFDRHELLIYEEVAKMPPFQRKTLVLIGAQGVGRRSLKNRLIMSDPMRFGTTIPFTSRKPKEDENDGHIYAFVSRAEMESDIKGGRYLEHGEYEGNLYGTKIDSIHEVVESGKICILDANPQALKVLRTSEFMPYVVFIEAPDLDTLRAMHRAAIDMGVTTKQLTDADLKKTVEESSRIQRAYNHYFDHTIINDNLDKAFQKLQASMEKLCTEPQWVPVSWVY
ncbi:MAGUK p55 subfamily member 2b isoform X4 [Hemitrygon akajei]|uniref:MAGUK p55 subfamily member 2b isoform X4 n=2 Tax=Dasyatidae TaxID=30469 RepID=UPI003BF9CCEA